MRFQKAITVLLTVLLLFISLPAVTRADGASFEYKLMITDQNGREVSNPRSLSSGDRLNVEVELKRTDDSSNSYDSYGMEFRLSTLGLEYNNDGVSFRSGTEITKQVFESGDSVGFAYYDMERVGESVNNPTIIGKWSYTVTDPSAVNISVPVALLYLVNESEAFVMNGNARLFLDPNGGSIIGTDVSGDYPSGTTVTLPGASFGDYVFEGWTDGSSLYAEGDEYVVSGIVTLTAQWRDLERNRQIIFDAKGGEISGNDPSGMYADGEKIVIPGVERDGYDLTSWTMEGNDYKPGDTYVVDNSVVFIAQWQEATAKTEPSAPSEPTEDIQEQDPEGTALWWIIPLIVVITLIVLFLLFFKRYVRYSLVDGGIRLSYRDSKKVESVQVYLIKDNKEYLLGQSGSLNSRELLKIINGTSIVSEIEKGFAKGRLHVTYSGKGAKDVKVLIRSIKEKLNEN